MDKLSEYNYIVESDFGAYFKCLRNKEVIWTSEENEAKHFNFNSSSINSTIKLLKEAFSIEHITLVDVNELNKCTSSKR